MQDTQRVTELAEAVADGRTPDWTAAESGATDPTQRGVIRKLKAVQSLGALFTMRTSSGAEAGDAPRLAPGDSWGALVIREHVGRGRFGEVYRAWDPALDREVALKLLRPRAGEPAADARVVDEGRMMARVRHPNVAAIYDAQRLDGTTGLWMEFVEGRTLAAEQAQRGLSDVQDLVHVGLELCRAIGAVHDAGLVHRDVKAQNVMRDATGRIVLGDFGTGQALDEPDAARTGLAGTPAYLAPEIFERKPATSQSDIYSLGALLFHLATARYPVEGRSSRELRDAHSQGRRSSLRGLRTDLPKRFVDVIERALDPDPGRRFEDAQAMRRALDGVLPGAGARVGLRRLLVGAVVAATAVAGVAMSSWRAGDSGAAVLPFNARDWVLITAFENKTGEALLDGTLEYALERELSNSTFVNVVPRERIDDTLLLMRQALDTRLDVAVAREVAQRDGGIKALVTGRIEQVGGAFVVSAQIVNPADGSVVGSASEGPVLPAALVSAVSRLAVDLRARLGETLPALAARTPAFEKVVTLSLKALHLYSQAKAMAGDGGGRFGNALAVERLLRDALKEDPDFVWAHILLAHALRAQVGREAEALEHFQRAAAAAATGGQVDRLIAVAELDGAKALMTADPAERRRLDERALAGFEAVLQIQPDHQWAFGCTVNVSRRLGRAPDPAIGRRLVELRPNSLPSIYLAHEAARLHGNAEEAGEYARRGAALDVPIDDRNAYAVARFRLFPAHQAWRRGDVREALAVVNPLADDLMSKPGGVPGLLGLHLSSTFLLLGQLNRAEQVLARVSSLDDKQQPLVAIARAREDAGALRSLLARLYPEPDQGIEVLSAFIDAGLETRARRVMATEKARRGTTRYSQLIDGQLALADGRVDDAIATLGALRDSPSPGAPQQEMRAAIRLADAWVVKGATIRAIEILEAASQQGREIFAENPFNGDRWFPVRENLAMLYRRAGRIADAEAVESELLRLLEVADEDHPIKRRLNARASGSPARR